MPKEMDEIEDMDTESSTVADDELHQTEQSAAEASATSSAATPDDTDADTLSVVRDVVAEREDDPATAASSAEGEESKEAVASEDDEDTDDYSNVPFNNHPDFKRLVRKKNEYRVRAEQSEGDAQRYQNVQAFIDQNGLSGEEVAQGFKIMALMKTDPQGAWAELKPLVQSVLEAAGEILPEDLRQRVDKKEITRDVALELSRTRAAEKARNFREQFQQTRAQTRQQIDHGNLLRSTAQTWLNERRLKDPNFAAKETRLHEKIAFLHATEGKPSDPAGVQAQLKKAYDAVNKELAPTVVPRSGATTARPAQKRAIQPVRGGLVANAPAPKPKNTMDVIRQVTAARQSA